MSQDIVADGINQIMNSKISGRRNIVVRGYSKLFLNVLEIANKEGYVKDYETDEENREVKIAIGSLNKCKPIKPRFHASVDKIEKYMERYLPSRNLGILIISTSKGLMTHKEALKEKIGGSLIAYFY